MLSVALVVTLVTLVNTPFPGQLNSESPGRFRFLYCRGIRFLQSSSVLGLGDNEGTYAYSA